MDESQNTVSGSMDANRSFHPTYTRESSTTLTQRTESWPSKRPSLSSQTSAQSSAAPSPLPSREPSPTRPGRPSNSLTRASSATPGARSRKNSQQDLSPTRSAKSVIPAATVPSKALSAATTPALLPPASADSPIASPSGPQKTSDSHKDPLRWPISPRLRSPPPILNKPTLPPQSRKGDQEPPVINVQRSSPSPQLPNPELVSDSDADDFRLPSGVRTPARGAGGNTSTLETVQEASPLASPRQGLDDASEKLADSITSETSTSQPEKAASPPNESGSEKDIMKTEVPSSVPSGATAAAPPQLTSRQSTASMKHAGPKGKPDQPLQSMTVETETVTSIPQVAFEQSAAAQASSTSLRTKPSSETIRPKKDKKKPTRKSPAVNSGTVSSKADIFEAKVASAVEEANSSDSEETFVYDSNPPDGRDRTHRFHSRTPSATSMMSQIDRNGMRSIPAVMENGGAGANAKKSMKFVSVNALNPGGTDVALGDEDGRGTGRSNGGSGRGTVRHHHHFGRWGRNGSGNHRSLFADEALFQNGASPRSLLMANNSRQSSGPPSPGFSPGRGLSNTGRRGTPTMAGYDLDDTTTGADDERTPLISTSARSSRSGRNRRSQTTMRQQRYHQPGSFLNRFATCLVLTVMLVLVISGAIGFMFATSQPLTDIELVGMKNVLASGQELMLDITVKAKNPNVVVVIIDSADIEVFAKSPHAGTDSEWWRRPQDSGTFTARRKRAPAVHTQDGLHDEPPLDDPPLDDKAPNMRLGAIRRFDSPLSFEGSFFHQGISSSTGEVRLNRPGNGTVNGSERWERILEDEFDLILKGVLKYTLPLSQRVRSVPVSGRTHVKPNSANEPTPTRPPNGTHASIDF